MVHRPTLLAVLLCVVLAGCIGTGTVQTSPTADPVSGTAATADTPADGTSSPTTDGHYRAYDFQATPATERDVVDTVTLSRTDVDRQVDWRTQPFVDDLFETGSSTRIAIGSVSDEGVPGPYDNGTLVRADGRIYRLEKTVVTRHEGPAYLMHLEGPMRSDAHENYSRAERVATTVSDLSPVDQRLVAFSIPSADEREGGYHSTGFTWVFPANASSGESQLVDGQVHYVRDDGDLFAVDGERQSQQAVRYRVRYRLVDVASVDAFAADSLDSYVTPVNGLTVDRQERDVLLETLEEGTVEWSGRTATPTRIRMAAEWIQNHPPEGSVAFVRYEGELYRLDVVHAVE